MDSLITVFWSFQSSSVKKRPPRKGDTQRREIAETHGSELRDRPGSAEGRAGPRSRISRLAKFAA